MPGGCCALAEIIPKQTTTTEAVVSANDLCFMAWPREYILRTLKLLSNEIDPRVHLKNLSGSDTEDRISLTACHSNGVQAIVQKDVLLKEGDDTRKTASGVWFGTACSFSCSVC